MSQNSDKINRNILESLQKQKAANKKPSIKTLESGTEFSDVHWCSCWGSISRLRWKQFDINAVKILFSSIELSIKDSSWYSWILFGIWNMKQGLENLNLQHMIMQKITTVLFLCQGWVLCHVVLPFQKVKITNLLSMPLTSILSVAMDNNNPTISIFSFSVMPLLSSASICILFFQYSKSQYFYCNIELTIFCHCNKQGPRYILVNYNFLQFRYVLDLPKVFIFLMFC